MTCWINKIKTNLQYDSRSQKYIIFAKVRHRRVCQKPFEDQLDHASHQSLVKVI